MESPFYWGLNRLGMTMGDRTALQDILASDGGLTVASLDAEVVAFLTNLGLVKVQTPASRDPVVVASAKTMALGAESWLQ